MTSITVPVMSYNYSNWSSRKTGIDWTLLPPTEQRSGHGTELIFPQKYAMIDSSKPPLMSTVSPIDSAFKLETDAFQNFAVAGSFQRTWI